MATLDDDRVGPVEPSPLPASPSGAPLAGSGWSTDQLPEENRLLSSLPEATQADLRARLERVDVGLRDLLWDKDQPISHVYFPLNGVISLIAIMSDGSAAEVGTVGNEGFVGLPVFLGASRAPVRAFCQVPGTVLRMTADDFRALIDGNLPLRDLLQRYTEAFFGMLSQTSACNRIHLAGQRMALWLLIVRDRVGADVFPMTQEFLAQMVGVRRATVNEEARRLQEAGVISFQRGIVTIQDGPALERASCECYAVIRGEYDRMIGGL